MKNISISGWDPAHEAYKIELNLAGRRYKAFVSKETLSKEYGGKSVGSDEADEWIAAHEYKILKSIAARRKGEAVSSPFDEIKVEEI